MKDEQEEPILSLRNVGVFYKRRRGIFGEQFWALKNISFDLYHGETLGIIEFEVLVFKENLENAFKTE